MATSLNNTKRKLELQIRETADLLRDESTVTVQRERWELLSAQMESVATFEATQLERAKAERSLQDLEKKRETRRERLEKLTGETCRISDAVGTAERLFESTAAAVHSLSNQRLRIQRARSVYQGLQRARRDQQVADEAIRGREQFLSEIRKSRRSVAADAPSEEELQQAAHRLADAIERLAQLKASYRQAEQRHARFTSLRGGARCDYCQQPVPESYVQTELPRITFELTEARDACHKAAKELASAKTHARTLERKQRDLTLQLNTLDCRVSELRAEIRSLQKQRTETIQNRDRALEQLASQKMTESEAAELIEGETRCAGQLAHTRNELQQAKEILRQRRNEHERAAEQQSLAAQEYHETERGIAKKQGELTQLGIAATTRSGELSAILADSAGPHLDRVQQLKSEHGRLGALNLPECYAEMQAARLKHERLTGEIAGVVQSIKQYPEDSRRPAAECSQSLDKARKDHDETKGRLLAARQHYSEMEGSVRERQTLSRELREADHEHHLWERLVKLIGREGLMRDLIRNAERDIVDYANAILDRLSAGNLYLQLREPADSKANRALELLVRIRTANGDVQEVAFLSGSQKFRVAVSLSLAIGQYAGQTRRPVQAVIIDEGFGCLDSVNRQVMIQELHNLKNYLERVVVVSHQEEFAAAFSDRLQTQLVGGTARLTPSHDN